MLSLGLWNSCSSTFSHMDLTGQFNFSRCFWFLIMFFIFSSFFPFRTDFNIKLNWFWWYFDILNHDSSWLIITDHDWSWLIIIDHNWSLLIMNDHNWSLLIMNGHNWSRLIMIEHKWSQLTMIDHNYILCMMIFHLVFLGGCNLYMLNHFIQFS